MNPRGRILLLAGALAGLVGATSFAFANESVLQQEKNPNLWPVDGGNYALQRHSTLSDINKSNVDRLQMVWSQSSGALRGHEGQPLVVMVDGTPMMFMESAWPNIIQALDLSDPDNPKEVWNYLKKTDRDESAVPRACCDTVNRGLSYADGKVVFGTLDGFVGALDAKTGKEIWVIKHSYPEHGETQINVPLVAGNLVIAGFGGDEFAARGRLDAYDLNTGKLVWSKESNGTDAEIGITADTNKDNSRHDQTLNQGFTYPGDEWKRGGGSPWAWYSYDPELKLIFEGNGNPGNWSPTTRCGANPPTQESCNDGKWDNKWSMTIMARHLKDGTVAWNYQMTPFDQWDYDGVNENILVDMPNVDGKPHKTLVHFDRNGFAYVLDRETGELLRAHKFVTVNWAERIDLKTGRPVKVYAHSPLKIGVTTQACPSAMGGKDQQPCAVDPKDPTKFYCPTNNWCMTDEPQARTSFQQGTVYVFANVYMYEEKPGVAGRFKKFDVLTGKEDWDIPDPYPNWGGALDLPEAKNAIILDIRTSDDDLRQKQCRSNVFHLAPSYAMRADALGQFLLYKRWQRWFLIHGSKPADLAYTAAVKRAASRFGSRIVAERTYTYSARSRTTDTGHQQTEQQMALLTQSVPAYDVIFVVDMDEVFGEYLLYNTFDPRPVVGTQGLIAVAWHRSFEEYAGQEMQNRFENFAHRTMTERDYEGWLAVRIFGEAMLRTRATDAKTLRNYILSDEFNIAAYKGIGLSFRKWDLQLRQPILLAGPRALVSIAPIEGFLHPKYLTDSLGYDKPETKCHFAK